MTMKDLKFKLNDFWKEFQKEKAGMVGLVIVTIFLFLLAFGQFLVPFPGADKNWGNINYWADNPSNAMPEWVNLFSSKKSATSAKLTPSEKTEKEAGSMKIYNYTFTYDYNFDISPNDILLHIRGEGPINASLTVDRPDGNTIELARKDFNLSEANEGRISIEKDARQNIFDFASMYENSDYVNNTRVTDVKGLPLLFAKAEEGNIKNPKTLKGKYKLNLSFISPDQNLKVNDVYVTVAGKVSGFLGTDGQKRDIWSGIVAGIKWAMIIGFLTSIVSVLIGVIYGVTSAYFGGIVDTLMQRLYELIASVPFLPLLIVISAILKPSIWTLILLMAAFGWTGSVRIVRSMALQIKEETYIEASRAAGATHSRIIFKHIVPLLLPYSFASMALAVPGAIVTEASLSLLGLGDSSIVTWGQILEAAMQGGAVINGIWWWIVPPGLAIVFLGMAFAFVGFAMDKILIPKMRTR